MEEGKAEEAHIRQSHVVVVKVTWHMGMDMNMDMDMDMGHMDMDRPARPPDDFCCVCRPLV
eukprot:3925833-Prymnesium_polylepis.1